MNTLIVKDAGKLNKLINAAIVQHRKGNEMLHGAALNAIWHGCHFGDARPLSRLFQGMAPNYRNALRAYLNRLSYEIMGASEDKLFSFSAKENNFKVLTTEKNEKAADYRAAAVLFIEDRLATSNPGKWKADATGKISDIKPFYASETFRSDLTDYTSESALAGLKAMLRTFNAEKAPGGGTVHVHKDIVAAVETAIKKADMVVNNDSAVEARREKVPTKHKATTKAKSARKPKAKPAETTEGIAIA